MNNFCRALHVENSTIKSLGRTIRGAESADGWILDVSQDNTPPTIDSIIVQILASNVVTSEELILTISSCLNTKFFVRLVAWGLQDMPSEASEAFMIVPGSADNDCLCFFKSVSSLSYERHRFLCRFLAVLLSSGVILKDSFVSVLNAKTKDTEELVLFVYKYGYRIGMYGPFHGLSVYVTSMAGM